MDKSGHYTPPVPSDDDPTVVEVPVDQTESLGLGEHAIGALATHTSVEVQADKPDFDARETRYIMGIFGDEGLNMVDLEHRGALAQAINEMYFHDKSTEYEDPEITAERLQNYFSDMEMVDIMRASEAAGRTFGRESERAFYAKVKRQVLEKFNYHQTRAVLGMVIDTGEIDWEEVQTLAAKGATLKKKPNKAKGSAKAAPKKKAAPKPVTLGDDTVAKLARRLELEATDFDPFAAAEHPPRNWHNNPEFTLLFDDYVSLLFDQAVEKKSITAMNANVFRRNLGLPVGLIDPNAVAFEQKPYDYLQAAMSVYPGRLKEMTTPRVGAMRQILRAFTTERLTLDQIVERYGGNPDAGLLLKGAIAEILAHRVHAQSRPFDNY